MNKNNLKVLIAAFAVIVLAANVYAAEPSGASITNNQTFAAYSDQTVDDTVVESGNISYADLSANMSTYRWAGLYGLTDGSIVLADDANDMMYNWVADGKMVYACQGNTIDWSSLVDADETHGSMPNVVDGSDNYTSTFSAASEDIPSGIWSGANNLSSDYVSTNNGTSTETPWKTYTLADGAAAVTDLVFAGNVIEGGQAYDGATAADYQILLPEDGTAGDTDSTQYYLWLELQ